MKKIFIGILILFLMICGSYAFADPTVQIDFSYPKSGAVIGQPFTVNYEITGGSGHYDSITYIVSGVTEHVCIESFSGELTEAQGSFTFIPNAGDYLELDINCTDSETGVYWDARAWEIPCAQSPTISVALSGLPDSCNANESFSFTFDINGNNTIDGATIEFWEFVKNETFPDCILKKRVADTEGIITYTPTTGHELYIAVRGNDAEGIPFYFRSNRIQIQGKPDFSPVTIDFDYDSESVQIGQPFTVSYNITGGSGRYSDITYIVSGVTEHVCIESFSGELEEAQGSFTFIPNAGDYLELDINCIDSETGVYWDAHAWEVDCAPNAEIPATLTILSSCTQNDPMTFSYSIDTNNAISEAEIDIWEFIQNDAYPDCLLKQQISTKTGTITYTPICGNQLYIAIRGKDVAGWPFYAKTNRIDINPSEPEPISFIINQNTVNAGEELTVYYEVLSSDIVIEGINWASNGWRSLPCEINESCSASYVPNENGEIWLMITYKNKNGELRIAESEKIQVVNGLNVEINISGPNQESILSAGDNIVLDYNISGGSGNYSIEFWWCIEIGSGKEVDTNKVVTNNASGSFSHNVTDQMTSISYTMFVFDQNGCSCGEGNKYQVAGGGSNPSTPTNAVQFALSSTEINVGERLTVECHLADGYTIIGANWASDRWRSLPLNIELYPVFSAVPTEDEERWFEIVYQDNQGYLFTAQSEHIIVHGISVFSYITYDDVEEGIGKQINVFYHIEGGVAPYSVETYWRVSADGIDTEVDRRYTNTTDGVISYIPLDNVTKFNYRIYVLDKNNSVTSVSEGAPFSIINDTITCDNIYIWNDDNTTLTARRGDDEETVPVRRTILSPTIDDEGEIMWLSGKFTNSSFKQQMIKKRIPALSEMNTLFLPAELQAIESEAFDGIYAEAIIIPEGCTTIEPNAFTNCKNLLYVRVPTGIEIPLDAFDGSSSIIIDQQ